MTKERIVFPIRQRWYIDRLKTLDLDHTDLSDGICFAIANMTLQACLADDLETFEKRFELIHKIPLNEFKATIEKIEQKRLVIIKQVKDEIGPYEKFKFTKDEIEDLNKDEEVKEKILALEKIIQELPKEQQEAELKRRKDLTLYYAFVQKKIDKKMLELSEEERLGLEIPIFFQNLVVYQSPKYYQSLFEPGAKLKQNTLLTLPLIASKKINPSEISQVRILSGIYTKNELIDFFESFTKTIQDFTPSITSRIPFFLTSSNHAITVIYDPHSSPENWLFIDANQLASPIPRFSAKDLGPKVTSAFSRNGITTFSTRIYMHKSNEGLLNECINLWEQNESFKKIHSITNNKLVDSDALNATWLYLAEKENHPEVAEKLLNAGANPNKTDKHGFTLLHNAARHGHTKIVELLLNSGANPNLADQFGITPIHLAAEEGYTEVVELLLNADANPNSFKECGDNPLLLAAKNGHTKIVELLLNAGADPNSSTEFGGTPLLLAARNGHTKIVELLLNVGAYIHLVYESRITPLFVAVEYGHTAIVNKLLNLGADSNSAICNGTTALYMAVKKGYTEIVGLLLKAGANPNLANANRLTPLFVAVQNGHTEIVDKLLKFGADPNLAIKDVTTALCMAAEKGYTEIVGLLLNAGAYPHLANENRMTPLFVAVQNGHTEIVDKLLKFGADPNSAIEDWTTALHIAAEKGHTEIVDLLLKAGANPNLTNTENETPLNTAEKNGHKDIMLLLLANGAFTMEHTKIVEFPTLVELNKKENISNLSLFKTSANESKPQVIADQTLKLNL